jgi:hypothetical protein
MSLAELNRKLETEQELPEEIWHEWLWGTDPEEAYHIDVLLNRNQLLALLVCRYKHLTAQQGEPVNMTNAARMTIMEKPVSDMTWRELKDTVSNILLEWPQFLDRLRVNIRAKQNLRQVLHLITQCAARFGQLAYTAAGPDIFDDVSETQPCHQREHADKIVLTQSALRRMAGSLLIMYRHIHLLSVCIKVHKTGFQAPISKYHYEASNDNFNILCMHNALPVAARLNYRHDFPGMYNHVSQVVYFHNTQYSRINRHPLEDIANAPAVHVLPAIQEIYPEIPLKFEEDQFDPTKPAGWYWVLIAGRVYLVTPEPKVLHSENISDLLKVYIDKNTAGLESD